VGSGGDGERKEKTMTAISHLKIAANILFLYTTLMLGKTMASEYNPKSFFTGSYLEAAKAIYSNNTNDLAKALNQINDLDKPSINGESTLLIYAVKAGALKSIETLLEIGASPEAKATDRNGNSFSAIYTSVTIKNTEPLNIFLKHGVSPNYIEENIPLIFSAQDWNNHDAINILVDNNLDVDIKSELGYSLLMDSLGRLDYDLAIFWLEKGVDVHHIDNLGRSATYSVQRGLERYIEGSEPHEKLQQIKKLMIDKGAEFPALSPEEQREKLGIVWCEDPEGWMHRSECNVVGD